MLKKLWVVECSLCKTRLNTQTAKKKKALKILHAQGWITFTAVETPSAGPNMILAGVKKEFISGWLCVECSKPVKCKFSIYPVRIEREEFNK